MTAAPIRLGAVGYLNARPLVFGLGNRPQFAVRFDVPSRCASLLHDGDIDVGLIPSIEYLKGDYCIAPDLAIASRGPVRSVALFTTRPIDDVRSIALDTSSRASIALLRVLCARAFRIHPALTPHAPDLGAMLAASDAALIIGDHALFLESSREVQKIDLGEVWTNTTGLPFVYAFWAGRPGVLTQSDVAVLRTARDEGVQHPEEIACDYFAGQRERQAVGAEYLRDNIKYSLGSEEEAGLELFFRYAAEVGVVDASRPLHFYEQLV